MIELKLIELRDKRTFIPCFAINCQSGLGTEAEDYLLRRAGFGFDNQLILFGRLEGKRCEYDAWQWNDRTFHEAHFYIKVNWDSIKSGQVIDVEFILGETKEPKQSEKDG